MLIVRDSINITETINVPVVVVEADSVEVWAVVSVVSTLVEVIVEASIEFRHMKQIRMSKSHCSRKLGN